MSIGPDDALCVVMQFLYENGFESSLRELQGESGMDFDSDSLPHPGALVKLIEESQEKRSDGPSNTAADAVNRDSDLRLRIKNSDELSHAVPILSSVRTVPTAHEKNVLTCTVAPIPEADLHNGPVHIATGSSDRTIRIMDGLTGDGLLCFPECSGAVLWLEYNPMKHNILVASCMDGSVRVCDTKTGSFEEMRPHSKYVTRARWNQSGSMFATCSYDKSVCVFAQECEGSSSLMFQRAHRFEFCGVPEAIEFVSARGNQYLVVCVRDDCMFQYINLESGKITLVNMNPNQDNWVSFTALDIRYGGPGASLADGEADGGYLLVSTDKSRTLLYPVLDSQQVRVFYGATSDDYFQPRGVFDHTGRYVYGTSLDKTVCVWDVLDQRLLGRLKGHTDYVRDLSSHGSGDRGFIATCSYDKTVRLWSQ